MQGADYYRGQAATARRLSRHISGHEVSELLEKVAQDYDDIADDLENGAVDIRHPELMNQPRRKR